MHPGAQLCAGATSYVVLLGRRAREELPTPRWEWGYAASWMQTSENTSSTHSGE